MSHVLIVGAEDSNSQTLRRMLPGRVLHVNSLAGKRSTTLLADASTVILNFVEAFVCARVTSAVRRAVPGVRVFAVARHWTPEDHEDVLMAGAAGCLTLPFEEDVVSCLISPALARQRNEPVWGGAIQYRHGYPGRHLGSVEQAGF